MKNDLTIVPMDSEEDKTAPYIFLMLIIFAFVKPVLFYLTC